MTGTEEGEEHVDLHIEKEEDDEEIQARNEVSYAVNDYNSEHNRNKQITLKSKDKDVDELLKLAIDALHTKFHEDEKNKDDKKTQPGTG